MSYTKNIFLLIMSFSFFIGIVSCTEPITDTKTVSVQSTLASPKISPKTGSSLSESDTVSITGSPNDATILYTTDGTDPDGTNGIVYVDPFTITEDVTVKAVLVKEGFTTSSVSQASYTFTPSVYLSSLSVTGYAFTTKFAATKYEYTTVVPNDVSSVTITWGSDVDDAEYSVKGIAVTGTSKKITGLIVGENEIEVCIKKGDLEQTYIITVKRQNEVVSSDCTLSSLKLIDKKDSKEISLKQASTSAALDTYTASVTTDIDAVNLAVVANVSTATVVINEYDTTTKDLILTEGSGNVFTIVVTAEDMVTVKTYSIVITQTKDIPAGDLTIKSSNPSKMQTGVALNAGLEFDFSEVVANQDAGSIVISPSVAISKSWSGTKLIISHGADFEYGTTYSVTISGFKNSNSEIMNEYVLVFSTEIKPAPEGRIYYKYTSGIPKIWLWEGTGEDKNTVGNRPICTMMGKTWPGPEMTKEGIHANWYYFDVDASLLPLASNCKIKFNGGGENPYDPTAKKPWFDGAKWYATCPDGNGEPEITIAPAGGTAKGEKIITVAITSDTALTAKTATFNGKELTLTSDKFSITLSDYLANNETATLTVAAANSKGLVGGSAEFTRDDSYEPPVIDAYGTTEKFAANAIYFLMTDRFVDGDSSNNQASQGTFNIKHPNGGNIGYLGGDLKGIYDNADYISSMGFGSVWITPIVSNPDKPFDASGCDKNKTGYHGYWSDNFYKVDEHWESSGLTFKEYTTKMRAKGLKTTLDIVCNHANPSYSMSDSLYASSTYGKLYDANGTKVADSGNKDRSSTTCTWFQGNDQLAQLADFKYDADGVFEYLVNAQMKWIAEGADSFRIDTIKHIPIAFWKKFSDRVRATYPDFFMFGECFDGSPDVLCQFQKPDNGAISVLDFACMYTMKDKFSGAGYSGVEGYMHLDDGKYTNPYDLVTFYDNHDMARVSWSDVTYIDAHNWLFTSRGIPCIYYGSEMAFKKGLAEHFGNRDYYGVENIAAAKNNDIYKQLCKIGAIRKNNVALQKGLQINLSLGATTAVFLRVYQNKTDGEFQTALVMLNKGDAATELKASQYISDTNWVDAETGAAVTGAGSISASVPAHGFKVFVTNQAATDTALIALCQGLMGIDRTAVSSRN